MKNRKPRTSSALINFISPRSRINTSFLSRKAKEVFNGGVKVFELANVNLRGALAEAPNSDEVYVFPVGLGEFSEKWVYEAERLKAMGKTVLMIEPRGIGLSTNPDMPGTIDIEAGTKDFAELFQSEAFKAIIKDRKVVLGGHSTGGHMATRLLVEETAMCNRVFCGAVLESPAIKPKLTDAERDLAARLTRLGLGFVAGSGSKDPAQNKLTNALGRLETATHLQKVGFARRLAPFNMRSKGTAGFAHHLDKSGDVICALADGYAARAPEDKFQGPITFILGKDDGLIDLKTTIDVGMKLDADIVVLDARHEPHLESGQRLEAYRSAVDKGLHRAFGDAPKQG